MTSTPSPHNGWLSLSHALSHAYEQVSVITESEHIKVSEALNRVVSEPIVAMLNVPPANNSAMDGYALRAADSHTDAPLKIVHTQLAGMPSPHLTIREGQAVRIMTGAVIPDGADCVIMQENTRCQGDNVYICQPAGSGENIRLTGSDIASGTTVIASGTQLTASHLILLASLGLTSISVFRRLKVGIMATGDELQHGGKPLADGQIYESNRTGTRALLAAEPVDITDYGIVADDRDALRTVLTLAASSQDLVISSGGVSVGDADFVKQLVDELGNISFWKIAIKPGKPFAFGSLGNAVFCGVPGNPVSAFVTTQQIVLPLIKHMAGVATASPIAPLTFNAVLATAIKRKPGRQEFLRARWAKDDSGQATATPLPRQSSGVMTTVTEANCYIVIPADCSALNEGDSVSIQPFSLLETK